MKKNVSAQKNSSEVNVKVSNKHKYLLYTWHKETDKQLPKPFHRVHDGVLEKTAQI